MEELDLLLLSKQGKIIHQVWFDNIQSRRETKKAFKKYEPYRQTWIKKNPTWYYHVWNKEESKKFMKMFYPDFLDLFKKYKYSIQCCDAIRYFILHRYGGLYVDMDSECLKPLDDMRNKYNKDIYFVETQNTVVGFGVSNCLMFSTPNHPFWKSLFIELAQSINTPWYYTRHMIILYSAGPAFINRMYHKYKYQYKLSYLPSKYFNPISLNIDLLTIDKSYVYIIHHYESSWKNIDTTFLDFMKRHYHIVLLILLLIIPLIVYCHQFKD